MSQARHAGYLMIGSSLFLWSCGGGLLGQATRDESSTRDPVHCSCERRCGI